MFEKFPLKISIQFTLISTLLLISLSSIQPAYALGKLGHQLVCDLAYQQLNPNVQAQVNYLLTNISNKEKQRINHYNFDKKNSDITLGEACTWPDAVKKLKEYKRFKSWHYVNAPRTARKLPEPSCKKNCITKGIAYHEQQLTTVKSTKMQAQALMFLGHWLGDIHQPMHVSFASDLGGNKTKISAQGIKCNNLHWLWDMCLLNRQTKEKKLDKQHDVLYAKLLAELNKDLSSNRPKAQQWQASTTIDWANESLALARASKTNYCQVTSNGACQPLPMSIKLNQAQLDYMSDVLNLRIKMASVRLAARLNELLK